MPRLRSEGPYRVGIIGCGHMAGYIDRDFAHYPSVELPYSHARGYQAVPETQLVALADVNPDRLYSFARDYGVPRSHCYTDYQEMLAKEALDIVSVTTPVEHHCQPVIASAEAGVSGILCEKPMAVSLEEADRMIEVCDQYQTTLVIAHPRRYNFVWRKVLEVIQEGRIGDVTDLVGFSRGHLLGSGSHMFDTLRMIAQRPVQWVTAVLDEEGKDPGGNVMIRFEGGLTAYVAASRNGKSPIFEVEIIGTEGVLRVLNNGCEPELRTKHQVDDRTVLHPDPWPYMERKSHIVSAINDLIQSARGGKRPVSDGREGRDTLELIISAHLSSQQGGRRIPVPVQERSYRIF